MVTKAVMPANSVASLDDPTVAGPIGSLALSVVRPASPHLAARALLWHESLRRLGLVVPLFLVHDLGLVLACSRERVTLGQRLRAELLSRDAKFHSLHSAYEGFIREAAESALAESPRQALSNGNLVVALLARVLRPLAADEPPARHDASPSAGFDIALVERAESTLPELYRAVDRSAERRILAQVAEHRLLLLALIDALDPDTMSLLGLLGDTSSGPLAQLDLLAALESAELNAIARFSLDILPSVLESKTRPSSARAAVEGYIGISRKGSIDSLVLSELAWDAPELMRRLAENEVLYYAREHASEPEPRRHIVLVDASASMRGDRATFARGLALALLKRLALTRERVTLHFFDSRLYGPHSVTDDRTPVAHLLSFRGERGRNPQRVFSELLSMLDPRGAGRTPNTRVHVFTHGALYIPRSLVQAVAKVCHLSVVFLMPSGGELSADYLDLLDAHWIVDHFSLSDEARRNARAFDILRDVEKRMEASNHRDAS